jgi:hypothetical protein
VQHVAVCLAVNLKRLHPGTSAAEVGIGTCTMSLVPIPLPVIIVIEPIDGHRAMSRPTLGRSVGPPHGTCIRQIGGPRADHGLRAVLPVHRGSSRPCSNM